MNNFDIVHLLAAGIKQLPSGRWVSTDFSEADNTLGSPGGKLHVLATAVLLAANPDAIVFTGGGKGYGVLPGTPEDRPILAEILRDELRDEGISDERMVLENASNNTYQELLELEKHAGEWKGKRIAIVTSRWHIPRTRAMIEMKLPRLLKEFSIDLLAAEDVLIKAAPTIWATLFDDAYKSAWMASRMEMEARGTMQIKEGTYNFR